MSSKRMSSNNQQRPSHEAWHCFAIFMCLCEGLCWLLLLIRFLTPSLDQSWSHVLPMHCHSPIPHANFADTEPTLIWCGLELLHCTGSDSLLGSPRRLSPPTVSSFTLTLPANGWVLSLSAYQLHTPTCASSLQWSSLQPPWL